jgi:hypothetical protein
LLLVVLEVQTVHPAAVEREVLELAHLLLLLPELNIR